MLIRKISMSYIAITEKKILMLIQNSKEDDEQWPNIKQAVEKTPLEVLGKKKKVRKKKG